MEKLRFAQAPFLMYFQILSLCNVSGKTEK